MTLPLTQIQEHLKKYNDALYQAANAGDFSIVEPYIDIQRLLIL
ncbi:TcaA NTF2-like domain-containing protein [Neobacillus cucumis]